MNSKNITSWDDVPIVMDLPFACRIVGKSYDRLKKLCQLKLFPGFKCGGEWRVDKNDLISYIEQQKAKNEN